jgi:hypothetical protein
MATGMKMGALWGLALCNPVDIDGRFIEITVSIASSTWSKTDARALSYCHILSQFVSSETRATFRILVADFATAIKSCDHYPTPGALVQPGPLANECKSDACYLHPHRTCVLQT